jgi:hypothetical protein
MVQPSSPAAVSAVLPSWSCGFDSRHPLSRSVPVSLGFSTRASPAPAVQPRANPAPTPRELRRTRRNVPDSAPTARLDRLARRAATRAEAPGHRLALRTLRSPRLTALGVTVPVVRRIPSTISPHSWSCTMDGRPIRDPGFRLEFDAPRVSGDRSRMRSVHRRLHKESDSPRAGSEVSQGDLPRHRRSQARAAKSAAWHGAG